MTPLLATKMEPLYAEAVYCTAGEERARALLESVRRMAEEEKTGDKWLTMAESLCQQAVFELQTRAVEVDERIEAGDTTERPPNTCQSLETLETLETNFVALNATENKWPLFKKAVKSGDVVTVDLWILSGMDPSVENNWAIRHASGHGHLPIVNRLLQDARVDPSARDNSAILWAYRYKKLPVVKRLLHDERVTSSLKTYLLEVYIRAVQ